MPEIPYVNFVLDGSLARVDFVRSQIQFLFVVEPYAGALASLAARCESAEARRVLEQNVDDERGGGDPSSAHGRTFRRLLGRLGVREVELDDAPRWPCVEVFNAAVREACMRAPVVSGIATIAAIEDLFTTISASLGRGIVARGWLARDRVVHYDVHEQLDRVHADTLYALLDPADASSEIERGLARGVKAMVDLYAGLLAGPG
ncbi:iron-containing redox enzyme family protein [Nannocystaceae bacterium ST9]